MLSTLRRTALADLTPLNVAERGNRAFVIRRDAVNKLAANISLGCNSAGVHYRPDGIPGILLGEAVALSILRDTRTLYHEQFFGFTLTRFDGTLVTICTYC